MDSGNYIFGANQRISLSCCPNFPASYPPIFLSGISSTQDLGPQKPFFLSGSTFKPSQKHLQKTIITPHPPHIPFFIEPTQKYHHGGSTPSRQALHPEQDVPACWEYAAHQDKESTPINSDHATSPMQPRHTPIPN